MAKTAPTHPADAKAAAAESSLAALKAAKEVSGAGGGYTVGPFGRPIPNAQFASQTFSFRNPDTFLHDPVTMIKNPEPGWRYAWPLMDDPQTQARLRGNVYKYVFVSECDEHTMAKVTTQKGATGDKVLWYKHVLVKISPQAWNDQYEAPAAFSQMRLGNEIEAFKDKVTTISKGVAKPSVEMGTDQGLS